MKPKDAKDENCFNCKYSHDNKVEWFCFKRNGKPLPKQEWCTKWKYAYYL